MKPLHLAGRGLACSLGLDLASALDTLRRGSIPRTMIDLPGSIAGSYPFHAIPLELPDWKTRARDLVRRVVAEAGLPEQRDAPLFIATSSFGIGAVERGAPHVDCGLFGGEVAGWLDWRGPVYVISTACTSGINALLAAQALLEAEETDEALVLGIELDNRLTASGFAALQLLSPQASRPFATRRDGLVLGEAVAALRLGKQGGAGWNLLGGASVVDGAQPTGASSAAAAEMYAQALQASGLRADEIDLIKVQAAGSPANDAAEAQALRATFGRVPPLLSLKTMLGHTMGASGVAEIVLLCACLDQGLWPGQAQDTDPALGVALASCMPPQVRRFVATILGFGGSHASLVLGRA